MKKTSNIKNLRRFLSYVRPYRWRLILSTLVGIAKYNLPIVFPWILKDVIDHVLIGKPGRMGLTLDQLMAFSVVLFLVLAAITYLRTFIADRLAQDIITDVRADLFHHLQRLPVDFFQRYRTGAISSRLITDAGLAQNFVGLAGTNLFMDFTSLASITAIVFYMNWKLALVTYCTLPFYLLLQKRMSRRMRETAKEARKRMEMIEGDLHETVSGIADVKSFAFEGEETKRFLGRSRDYLEMAYRNIRSHGFSLGATTALTRIPSVLVVWVGAHMVLNQTLTVGSLMAFYAYLEMIYNPLRRLSELNMQLADSLAAMDRLFEFFDLEPETGHLAAPSLSLTKGTVLFDDVTFGYEAGHPVLKGICAQIAGGGRVAFVGESGAGKSTLIKLLVRFFDPWHGMICIDGQDIRDVNLGSLRSQIALVQQDLTLFSGSIEDNMRVGKPNATREEIVDAAQRANALSFIEEMPDGLETEVGERGVRLSGGQKQRIAIARAFLKNAPILVLDESTSNLDSQSEALIHGALERLMETRTTIMIAHRLSTVMLADRVIVFHQGEVVQEGSHRDLVREVEGRYYELYGNSLLRGQP